MRREGRRAAVAREILDESIARCEAREKKKRLAADYAAGREDAHRLLDEMEAGQLDLLSDEDD